MYLCYSSKQIIFTIFILCNLIGHITLSKVNIEKIFERLKYIFFLATVNDKSKRSDDKDNIEPISVSFNLNKIFFDLALSVVFFLGRSCCT
jgi:hypothetical protein